MISDSLLDVVVGQQVPFHFYFQDDVSVFFDDKVMAIKDSSGNDTVRMGVASNGQLAFQAYDPNTGQWSQGQSLTPTENSDNSTRLPHADTITNYVQIDNNGFKVYLANQLKATIDSSGLALENLPITGLTQSSNMSAAVTKQTFEDARYDLKTNPTTQVAQVLNLLGQPVVIFGSNTVQSQLKLTYSQRPSQFTSQDIPDTQYVNDEIDTCQPLNEKGQINGYAPLDSFGFVPASHLPILQLNQTYVGNDNDKTNPSSYTQQLPIRGTLYIATDTQKSYILAGDDYTVSNNWTQLAPTLNVLSLNGRTGIVTITSDDVPEGTGNLYFASGMSNYLSTYANTIGNLLKLNNSGLIESQFYGNRLVLNNGVVAIRDDQSQALYFENAVTNATILKVQQSDIQSEVPIQYSTRPTFNQNQQLIDKQYVDDSISIFATDRIHDTTNDCKVICQDSSNIVLRTNNQVTAIITNQLNNAEIQSQGIHLSVSGDNSTANIVQINGNRDENLIENITKLNIIQEEYATRQCLSELNLQLSGSSGASLQIQSGVDPALPLGQQNFINIQSQSANTDLLKMSAGIPDSDATIKLIADKNAGTNPIQTQFNRKTGYDQSVAITEPYQFTSKQYTDTKMSIDYTLSDISTRNATNGDISINNHYINNVLDPTTAQQAATKNYVDTRSVNTLSSQVADYSTQGYKITNLANATLATDALNRQTGDGRYYLNTTALNNITLATSDVNVNSHKITSLAEPTLAQDGATKNYVDVGLSGKYDNTTTLDNITLAASNVNVNGHKIINLADPTSLQDGATKSYVDVGLSGKYANTTTLDNITLATSDVNINNHKVINLAEPTQAQDGTTKNYVDVGLATKYDNTTALNSITLATSDVNVNNHKIINLTDPTSAQDGATKNYVDVGLSGKYDNTTTLNNITLAAANVSINGHKIINLAEPTLAQDGATKSYIDTGLATKYDNTTTLNNIVIATGNVNINGNKMTNLADATLATDALNRQTGDSRYYLNTVTLNNITLADSDVNVNNHKIINLAEPTAASDSTTKNYVDNGLATKYANTTTLNNITLATSDVDVNNNKIVNLSDATLATDALNRQTGDGRYYLNTTTLDDITLATSSINANSNKIINVSDATLATDALNRQTGDGRYYLNTTTLNNITAPLSSVSLNSQKIINLADPTLNQDGSTKKYVDDGLATKYDNTTTLNNITLATSSVNLNSNKITGLADATLATDALNRQTGDGRYYLNTATLDTITLASGNIDANTNRVINISNPINNQDAVTKYYLHSQTINNLAAQSSDYNANGYKITNLADATLATDALNRQTGDGRYYLNTTTLNNITTPTSSVSLNSQKITNMLDPTLAQDGATKNYVDVGLSGKYDNTTTLDNITLATSNVNLNSNKIIGLANATLDTDALNRYTGDNRYYLNTVPLNSITLAASNVSINSNKIINLADPTLAQDGATKSYVDVGLSGKYDNTTTLDNITAATGNIDVNSQKIINLAEPTASNDSTTKNYVDTGLATKYANTTTLNNITLATSSVNVNNNKIINLADATLATDALNRQTADARYYLNTTTLNSITAPIASVSLNSNKITNLADPTLTQDAATKNYVDTVAGSSNQSIDQIATANATTADWSNSGYKITNMADPTNAQDAATKFYVDSATSVGNATQIANAVISTSKLVANQTEITNGTTPLNMNSQKITGVANPTVNSDAVNLVYGNDNYMAKTSKLSDIQSANPLTGNLDIGAYTVQTSKSTGFASNELIPKTYADATYGIASFPVGAIIAWHSTSIPTNWLLCDGQSFSAITYPDLAVVLGSTVVPDFRGYFLRGLDTGAIVDPGGASRVIGDSQLSDNKAHTHIYQDVAFMAGGSYWANQTGSGANDGDNHPHWRTTLNTITNNGADPNINIPTSSTGITESRPTNKAVNYIIRAAASVSYITGVYPSLGNIDLLSTYKVQNSIDPTSLQDLTTVNFIKSLIKQQEYVQLISVNSFPAINNYIGDANWTNKQMNVGTNIAYSSSTGQITLYSGQTYEISVSFTSSSATAGQVILYDTVGGTKLCTLLLGIDTTSSATLDPWWVEIRNNQTSGWVGTGASIIVNTTVGSVLGARVVSAVPGNYSTYTLKVKVLTDYYIDQSSIV